MTAPLTPRERQVVSLLLAGNAYAEIATALHIARKTVGVHVSNAAAKLPGPGKPLLRILRSGLNQTPIARSEAGHDGGSVTPHVGS